LEAEASGIPIIRRYSGGGAVYHDLGNVNYSFHCEKSKFNRTFAAEMIINALKPHCSNLFLSSRHDIFIKLHEESKKVSGSAYKLSRDRAYHHGTFLLSTDLHQIQQLLCSPLNILKDSAQFKFGGVSSVPSPVSNLVPALNFEEFFAAVLKEFNPTEGIVEVSEDSFDENSEIFEYKRALKTWEWTFSKSPPFRVKSLKDDSGDVLTIENGLITHSTSGNESFIGKPFEQLY